MRYIPNTPNDIAAMLEVIGVDSIDTLFEQIPKALQLDRPLDIPDAMNEPALLAHMKEMASQNRVTDAVPPFLGAGVYAHVSPTAVDHLIQRGEFFTAYTPYQPELSQGTLQVIYEFQSMIAGLLATDVANASLYDGSTGMSEAIQMARRITRRDRILVSQGVHPEYVEVAQTYQVGMDGQLDMIPLKGGQTDLAAFEATLDKEVACVVIQTPNFFGCLEELQSFADKVHEVGALLVAITNEPTAFGCLTPPGEMGADIVAGEGQPLGLPVNLGGPHCGLFGARQKFMRQMPGRLCGRSKDSEGRPGFVLTLSTREQHIRREKATSNICTNQGLMALAICIYLTLMGPKGLAHVARTNLALGKYLSDQVRNSKTLSLVYPDAPIYNEVSVRVSGSAQEALAKAEQAGIAAGVPLSRFYSDMDDVLLINVTERHTQAHIDALIQVLDS